MTKTPRNQMDPTQDGYQVAVGEVTVASSGTDGATDDVKTTLSNLNWPQPPAFTPEPTPVNASGLKANLALRHGAEEEQKQAKARTETRVEARARAKTERFNRRMRTGILAATAAFTLYLGYGFVKNGFRISKPTSFTYERISDRDGNGEIDELEVEHARDVLDLGHSADEYNSARLQDDTARANEMADPVVFEREESILGIPSSEQGVVEAEDAAALKAEIDQQK